MGMETSLFTQLVGQVANADANGTCHAGSSVTGWLWAEERGVVFLQSPDFASNPVGYIISCFVWLVACVAVAYAIRRLSWWNHPLYFNSRQLPVVPYFLPWIGSSREFRSDALGFVKRWSEKLDSRVFGVYMAGRSFIFITDPFIAAHVVSGRIPQLTWQRTKFMMMKNGLNSSETGASVIAKNRSGHAMMEKYLKGEEFPSFFKSWQDSFHQVLHSLIEDLSPSSKSDQGTATTSLKEWTECKIFSLVGRIIFRTSADILLGDELMATEQFFEQALLFDSRFFKLCFMPKTMHWRFPKECNARDILLRRMKTILSEDRSNGTPGRLNQNGKCLSNFIRELNTLYDVNVDDLSRFDYLVFAASFINAIPTTFWVVYHLLADEAAYSAIEEEVLGIYSSTLDQKSSCNDKVSFMDHSWTIMDLEKMIKMESILDETLRLRSTTLTTRTRVAVEDFNLKLVVDGETKIYPIKKGTAVFSFPTLTHRDEEIFKDAMTFKWDRFLPGPDGKPPVFTKNGEVLRRPIDAFGGGPTMCPGRRFAKMEIKAIVATLLLSFEIRFAGGTLADPPPMKDLGTGFSLGMPDADVSIELRMRN